MFKLLTKLDAFLVLIWDNEEFGHIKTPLKFKGIFKILCVRVDVESKLYFEIYKYILYFDN